MWMKQYRKTFVRMQTVIGLVTAVVYFRIYRSWEPTLSFFLVLQGAAVAGALWGSRLKERVANNGR